MTALAGTSTGQIFAIFYSCSSLEKLNNHWQIHMRSENSMEMPRVKPIFKNDPTFQATDFY